MQLDPPIPVFVPGKGSGLAHLVIDMGAEHHLLWTIAMDDTGEFWSLKNPDVRAQWNATLGRLPRERDNDRQQEGEG